MENVMAGKAVSDKSVSIIIVSYNGLNETTVPCLQSIFEQTDYPDYEVIVVDNGSTDGTQHYLKVWADKEPRLRCIFNTTNRGFAGGNNDAIKAATGRFLVLLNNDTRVTRGWLERFVSILADPAIGLAGPVSNATGNEQTIYTAGTTPEEILNEGLLWARMSRGDVVSMERLCFFCVAMRRDMIDNIGLLDETYGLGFYEDDDYCLRVRNAGLRLICCEDVFVYHRGSASFKAIPQKTRQLLKSNRRLLEHKFAFRYRPRHARDRILDLLENYIADLDQTNADRMRFKIDNRLRQLPEMQPRSIFKRVAFGFRMKRIQEMMA